MRMLSILKIRLGVSNIKYLVKDFIIKLIFILVGVFCLGFVIYIIHFKTDIKIIGESKWAFNNVFRDWHKNSRINTFHRSVHKMKEAYLLLEIGGAINGPTLDYYLIKFDHAQIQADFRKIRGTFIFPPRTIGRIKKLVTCLKPENELYDASSDMTGDVYFLTYQKEDSTIIKYGFYASSGLDNKFSNKTYERIARENRLIYCQVIDLIEKEIYRQRPELIKLRPLYRGF